MILSIVVPIFNEQESIPELIRRLEGLRKRLSPELDVKFIFVDDGSTDESQSMLMGLANKHEFVKLISFSRNFGHQIAITAGIDHAEGDYVAIIDGDLQDPPELIEDMYKLAQQGYDLVYGRRRSRSGETWFKKISATVFYRLLSYMCDIDIPYDTGDFRLMSRKVAGAFRSLRERHRFVRGMVPWIGFNSVALEYDRDQRYAGQTKYPLRKMISFAATAILSFSRKPLTIATRIGVITVVVGLVGALYMLYLKLFTGTPVPGLTAILTTIVIFGGMQIFLIGLVGEYIARIFEEVKGRPLYIIDQTRNL